MHIWYIEHYSGGPGLGVRYRPFHLGRAWRELGHTATIFMASFHHLIDMENRLEPEFEIEGIKYVTVPTRAYDGNGLGRLLNIWDFTRNLYAVGQRFAAEHSPPDAVIASTPHPFTIYPGKRLAECFNAKLVYEVRDIWPLSITELTGASPMHPFVQLCAMAERFSMKNADLVASVLPQFERYLQSRGHASKPFVWVPNGISHRESKPHTRLITPEAETARSKLKSWQAEGRVTIIYTGAVGRPNAVDLLLKALKQTESTNEQERCGVLIVGKGEELETLRSYARENRLLNTHFTGGLPKTDALALLEDADIGYAGLRTAGPLFSYGISPNKIIDYFTAGLPVFLPIDPCGDPVSRSGGGIVKRVDTPSSMWRELRSLVQMTPEQRKELGRKGRDYLVREYDYAAIADRFARAITDSAN